MEESEHDRAISSFPDESSKSPTTRYSCVDESIKTLTYHNERLKKQWNQDVKPDQLRVKIESYIDSLSTKCEQTREKKFSKTPPLSTDVETPPCKLEGFATCYTTGYICFLLEASRQTSRCSQNPILFDVKVFLSHPKGGDPLMVGEKQFILRNEIKVASPQILVNYKDIHGSNYVSDDKLHFWWQVWVREKPKELDLDLIKETSKAMSCQAKRLRELSQDCEIKKITDVAHSICKCLDPSTGHEPVTFCYRIDKIEKILEKNTEMYTPLYSSPSHRYSFLGFLICREDNSLAAYLYLGPVKQMKEVIWPVKIHWKVSLVDQASGRRRCMGEKISLYDKPTPADNSLLDYPSRIEFNKEQIESAAMIINQALTVEWTVSLYSPVYANKVTDLTYQCDQLTDILTSIARGSDEIGSQDRGGHEGNHIMIQQCELSTGLSGIFNLMISGTSSKAEKMIGNLVLQQHNFTKEQAEDKVLEEWRHFENYTVTIVVCPLHGCFKSGERDQPGTVGNRLTSALAKFEMGFHATLFVFDIEKTFGDEEYKFIEFLKTHVAEDIVRDFFICVIIRDNDSSTESEGEFDLLGWCKAQTGIIGKLLKECNYRCVLFHNSYDELSMSKTQRNKLLNMVSEMRSRECRLKKIGLDWAKIPFTFSEKSGRIVSGLSK